MTSLRRALGLGVLSWLVPFLVSIVVFPLRASNRPLFESIMPVAVATTTVVLALAYFRRVEGGHVREGLALGLVWLVICLLVDAPLMLLGGPMQMSLAGYAADIGATYLMIPVITAGVGAATGGRT